MAKTNTSLQVVLPKKLLTAAASRINPAQNIEKGTEIQQSPLFSLLNNTARNYRAATNITQLIRHLARAEGPLGTAVHNMVEVAQTKYRVVAYDSITHQFSAEGTTLAYSIIAQMDNLYDYSLGFTSKRSISSTVEVMLREAALTGAVATELVLNKARLPDLIQVVGVETLTFLSNGAGGFFPSQKVAGQNDPVQLNIANFWVEYVHPDPDTIIPRSMLESALKMMIYFEEFMEEIRRVVRQSGHNRTKITLDAEKIKLTAPRPVQNDPVKLAAYFEQVRDAVQTMMETVEPEQAVVVFDCIDVDVINSGLGVKMDYTPLLEVIIGQYATAMKTPPSILGLRMQAGSQAIGNVETLIFLKSVQALHKPVETTMSRLLTLACRLFGLDVYTDFTFADLDLRPKAELEAFEAMRQQRVLEQLSLGLITDEQAAIELDVWPLPPGMTPLSGTMFASKAAAPQGPAGSAPGKATPGDTPVGKQHQPDKKVPRKAGGKSQ